MDVAPDGEITLNSGDRLSFDDPENIPKLFYRAGDSLVITFSDDTTLMVVDFFKLSNGESLDLGIILLDGLYSPADFFTTASVSDFSIQHIPSTATIDVSSFNNIPVDLSENTRFIFDGGEDFTNFLSVLFSNQAALAVNVLPQANDDGGIGFITDEDMLFTTANVFANDFSLDILTLTGFDTTGTLGFVTNNGDGTFVYDPNSGFEPLFVGSLANDTFTYTAVDGSGNPVTATVFITIEGVNDAPMVSDVVFSLDENSGVGTFVGAAVGSDIDVGDSITFSIIAGNALNGFAIDANTGNITVNNAAPLDFETNPNFMLIVQIEDQLVLTDTATVNINLNDLNEPPVAIDNSGIGFTTNEDSIFITANILDNDFDLDAGDAVALLNFDDSGILGSLLSNGDGTFNYSPNGQFESLAAGESAVETFTYTIEDNFGLTDTAMVTLTINGVNDQATLDPLSTNIVTPNNENIVFRFEASDVDGDGLTSDNPADGSAIVSWQDKSGNNNDTITSGNSPDFASSSVGTNPGVTFNGTNEGYRIGNAAEINLSIFAEKTIEANFQTGSDVSGFQVIYKQGGGVRGYHISINDGELFAFVYNIAEWAAGDQFKAISLGNITANTEYNVTAVHNANDGTFTAYLDGIQMGQLTGVAAQNPHGGAISVGRNVGATRNPENPTITEQNNGEFEGSISHVTSWNRALDEGEIAANAVGITNDYVFITNEILNAQDVDDAAIELTYQVQSTAGGFVAFESDPGTPILTFTQFDVDSEQVIFVSNTTGNIAQVDLLLVDGLEDGTIGVPVSIHFAMSNSIEGTAGAETLIGTEETNLLDGLGGSDTLISGAGDDILVFDSLDTLIEGDAGFDILRVSDSVFDMAAITTDLNNIEKIQLVGSSQSVILNAADLLDITDGNNILKISGDTTDSVSGDFTGYTQAAQSVNGYIAYSDGTGTLLIDTQIDASGITGSL